MFHLSYETITSPIRVVICVNIGGSLGHPFISDLNEAIKGGGDYIYTALHMWMPGSVSLFIED